MESWCFVAYILYQEPALHTAAFVDSLVIFITKENFSSSLATKMYEFSQMETGGKNNLSMQHVLCMFICNFPLSKISYVPRHYCDPCVVTAFPDLMHFLLQRRKTIIRLRKLTKITRHRLVLKVTKFTGSFVGSYKAHYPLLEKETYALCWQSSSVAFLCVL